MILDRQKTIALLTDKVLETKEEYSITADNLDEIQLVIVEDSEGFYVGVENEHGTLFDVEDLSDGELEIFCYEYVIDPIYDVEASIQELKQYMAQVIKDKLGFYEEYNFNSKYVQDKIAGMKVDSLLGIYKAAMRDE